MKQLPGVALLSVLLISLSACVTQLAPAYDQAVSSGLLTANQDMQALFVSVGTESTKETYPTRDAAYGHLIAELNAIEVEIKTRPTPNADALTKANAVLTKLNVGGITADPGFSPYPSARAVADLSDTLQHMQTSDKATGLRGGLLAAYENQATTFLTQAMTYENFLKR